MYDFENCTSEMENGPTLEFQCSEQEYCQSPC